MDVSMSLSPRRLLMAVPLVVAGSLLLAACSPGDAGRPANPPPAQAAKGAKIGDIQLTQPDGSAVQLKSLTEGKLALIDVWATWCNPCLQAVPHLDKLHQQFRDRGFTVVGIMIDTNASKIGPGFLKEHSVSYPVVLDDDAARTEQAIGAVSGIPLLLLVDKDGTVLERFEGFGDPAELEKAVTTHLKG